MAVFTPVSLTDLDTWMQQFPLGKALSIRGISSGIENSNFFILTERGEYVLTIFEVLNFEQLPFYLKLMQHLAERGILVPAPVPNLHGELITPLHGKPAAIVSKLEGQSHLSPSAQDCAAVGAMLARMHLAGQDYALHQPNLRGLDWWEQKTPEVLPQLTVEIATLLRDEVIAQGRFQRQAEYAQLPHGPIHADLFRNNVMFHEDRLSGFFDFYFAGCDRWLFDVAVTVNDWCVDLASGELAQDRVLAMLNAYHEVRPFLAAEAHAWPMMLRAAALRFWLSRLVDLYRPRAAEMLTPHDPTHFERILRLRQTNDAPPLPL